MRNTQQILMEMGAALDRFLVRAIRGERGAWEMVGVIERSIKAVCNDH